MNDNELDKVSRDPRFAPVKRKNVSTTRSVKQLFEGVEQETAFKDKRGRPWLKNPKAFARAQVAQKRARAETSKSESSEEVSTEESDVSSLSSSDEQDPFESIADLQDADFTELVKDAETTESPTRRLALLHFDWDNTKAENIFMALESFLPARGHIERVTIYPSEFGMKRMAEETIKGPPELVDHHSDDEKLLDMDEEEEEESSDASENADNPLDVDDKSGWRAASVSLKRRVRKYQIARLKYFYAIIEFDSKETAEAVYEACDGFEYESSGVRFDLRFVSDDEQFSVPSEYAHMVSECREINKAKYAPRPFETSALHSTRISVTWDQTPAERTCWLRDQFKPESDPKKTLTENRDELEKYLALSSSGASTAASSDLEEEPPAPTVPRIHRHRPKKLPPAEIRAALLSALGEMPADGDEEENKDESAEEEEEEVIDLNSGQNPGENDSENEEYDLGPVEKKTSKEAIALKKKGKVSRRILPEALDDQADDSSNVSGEEEELVERKEKTKKKKQKQRQKMLAKKRKVQERNEKQAKLWPFPENKDNQVEEDSRFDSFLTDPAFRITQTHPEYKEAADFLRYMRIRKSNLMLNSSKEVADIGAMR